MWKLQWLNREQPLKPIEESHTMGSQRPKWKIIVQFCRTYWLLFVKLAYGLKICCISAQIRCQDSHRMIFFVEPATLLTHHRTKCYQPTKGSTWNPNVFDWFFFLQNYRTRRVNLAPALANSKVWEIAIANMSTPIAKNIKHNSSIFSSASSRFGMDKVYDILGKKYFKFQVIKSTYQYKTYSVNFRENDWEKRKGESQNDGRNDGYGQNDPVGFE